jgi:DNA (cytosine-5)-methyltransferase 1
MTERTIRFVDLFAGIGGLRLGFEQACSEVGIQPYCVLSSEIDKRARDTYHANFSEYPSGDIKEIPVLPDTDVLLAGFPCQAFSYAGKQKGFGDTRGTLFFEIERLLQESSTKPALLILENVRGILNHDEGRTFATICNSLSDLGYSVNHVVINSSTLGVPQNRIRVYIVGSLREINLTIESNLGFPDSHRSKSRALTIWNNGQTVRTVGDILEPASEVGKEFWCSRAFHQMLKRALGGRPWATLAGMRLIDYRGGKALHSWELGMKGKCSAREIEFLNMFILQRRKKRFGASQDGKRLTLRQMAEFWPKSDLARIVARLTKLGYLGQIGDSYNPVSGNYSFEVFKILDNESVSITLVSSDASKLGVLQGERIRRLTPRECARLQGFPDSFQPHALPVIAYRQFGNSVSVPVVKHIAMDVLQAGWLK